MPVGDPCRDDGARRADVRRDHPAGDGVDARKADELGAKSLALVAFGTGVGGFPLEEAAQIEVSEVRRHLEGDCASSGSCSRFAASGAREAFERALSER